MGLKTYNKNEIKLWNENQFLYQLKIFINLSNKEEIQKRFFNLIFYYLSEFLLDFKPVGEFEHKDVVSRSSEHAPDIPAKGEIPGIFIIGPVLGPYQIQG